MSCLQPVHTLGHMHEVQAFMHSERAPWRGTEGPIYKSHSTGRTLPHAQACQSSLLQGAGQGRRRLPQQDIDDPFVDGVDLEAQASRGQEPARAAPDPSNAYRNYTSKLSER